MEKEYEKESEYIRTLIEMEDLAEKKAQIYARLLIEPSLAQEMEGLTFRHAQRKARLEALLFGEDKVKGRGQICVQGGKKDE